MKIRENKRAHKRLPAYHLVKYSLEPSKTGLGKVITYAKDISAGGLCLLVDEDFPLSQAIRLNIQFPGISQPIRCLAKVVWKKFIKGAKKYRIGLKFTDIDGLSRKGIEEHINGVLNSSGNK